MSLYNEGNLSGLKKKTQTKYIDQFITVII